MCARVRQFLALAVVSVGLVAIAPAVADAHWGGYYGGGGGYGAAVIVHTYGGYPYPFWGYAPGITLPPVYVYPPFGMYYVPYYSYAGPVPPVGTYYTTYPAWSGANYPTSPYTYSTPRGTGQ
jgi:hypothetical protein